MLQTRTDARQVSTRNTQPNAARSMMMRDRHEADAMLRDMAYVLQLTRKVRESITANGVG